MEHAKPEIVQGKLTVKDKVYLTPHYIRITLTGKDIDNFTGVSEGANNKMLIPLRGSQTGEEAPTVMRTYTLRRLDNDKKEMLIDFVVHGDDGPASAWAIHASAGDEVVVKMKKKLKELYRPAEWYLIAGDHTALPVISVMLEKLPAEATGMVFIEVYGKEDVLHLSKPDGVVIRWLFNEHPGNGTQLQDAVTTVEFPSDKTRYIFAAAEAESVKAIQHFLRDQQRFPKEEWSVVSYWKLGQAEDKSVTERREIRNS